ncbi:MAG: sigma-54-dependent Fis family transcriptional regulator [Ignavibacteriales bacterium]|nr:sigma-54-dependent Fis family transcriptional regulator [Ignavibacteriota bacterium]MCB9248488.1 sigma-54-dependent Fis family transcriptional regulator [Ignavibacteriales bacterium]
MTISLNPTKPILLVDDEQHFVSTAELILNSNRLTNVETCSDSSKVLSLLKNKEYSLVALDINMPNISGKELLPKIIENFPDMPVIMITAINDVENAVECMKLGAFDYLVKPVDDERLISSIKRGLYFASVWNENIRLKETLFKDKLEHPEVFSDIITNSTKMRSIFKYIEAIAKTNLPILVTGETGVGKELIATAIHKISGRVGELVPVNVAGVDDNLFSDTLFGHKKGAYTGAEKERKGLIEHAENGTLFLDEIGDLSIESQVKLLRLLQDGKYYPLGSDVAKLSDARVIVATHKNLDKMKDDDSFRKDLYYRLKAHHVHIPPLKERKEDIPILISHFLNTASEELNKKRPASPKELYTILSNYSFPGNVRELEGIIFDAVSRHTSGVLSIENIRKKTIGTEDEIKNNSSQSEIPDNFSESIIFTSQFPTFKTAEILMIREALKRSDNNQTIAAQLLGITRRALNNRIQRLKDKEPDLFE